MEICLLLGASFFAGLVDSVSGGGGLIQLPALLMVFPNAPLISVLAANKFASACGTGFAIYRYRNHLSGIWKRFFIWGLLAFLASFAGAQGVRLLEHVNLKPFIAIILLVILVYTLSRSKMGLHERPPHPHSRIWVSFWILSIGLYDGFIGPGTGGFFIFVLVNGLGFHFLRASAAAKVLNFATNIAALISFGSHTTDMMEIALPLGLANLSGSFAGTFLANTRGAPFVRLIFILSASSLLALTLFRSFF